MVKKIVKKSSNKAKKQNNRIKKRPVGVVAIAVLLLLIGLFVTYDLFIFVRALFNGFPINVGILFSTLFFVVAVVCFSCVYGLIRLKRCGRILTIVLSALFIIYSGFNLWAGMRLGAGVYKTSLVDTLVVIVFLVIGLYLLLSKKVKESFK